MATIAVLGTLDSKGEEHAFVAALIVKHGHKPLLIDVGTGGPATVQPDITREQVAASAGIDLAGLMAKKGSRRMRRGHDQGRPGLRGQTRRRR